MIFKEREFQPPDSLPTGAEVVIIGAGIVGAATAYYLAKAGLVVWVVDRGGIAAGTSGSGEGNILLSDKLPGPELELAKAGVKLYSQLSQELPDDFEYEPKGGVVVAETERGLPGLHNHVTAMTGSGVRCQLLSEVELREAEPFLSHNVGGASFFPDDAQVQPMLAAAALIKGAIRAGAIFQPHTEVRSIERDQQGQITAVVTSRGKIATNRVVNAAGPWSPIIAALAGIELPIKPRKGHIIVTEPLPKLVYHKVFEAGYSDTVNSSEADLQVASVVEGTKSGTILIGSSRQLVGFDTRIEVRVLRALAERAIRFFPVLERVNALRAYTGFRAFAPDHLPVIGEVPGVPGFYINTGHEGAGIGLGPISGQLLSQLICEQPPALDPAPYSPARFKDLAVKI
ncbi:MAG TPA: FAD-binding oxidoreductase [Chloroflexia bacterium]|nr:FAD-binding oxidoreductase [Chloroflexia bacterium]